MPPSSRIMAITCRRCWMRCAAKLPNRDRKSFVPFNLPIGLAAIIAAGVIALIILANSIRIANEWQRAVILRLGRFHRIGGPGLYLVIPILEQVTVVIDNRIQTTNITAEQALT